MTPPSLPLHDRAHGRAGGRRVDLSFCPGICADLPRPAAPCSPLPFARTLAPRTTHAGPHCLQYDDPHSACPGDCGPHRPRQAIPSVIRESPQRLPVMQSIETRPPRAMGMRARTAETKPTAVPTTVALATTTPYFFSTPVKTLVLEVFIEKKKALRARNFSRFRGKKGFQAPKNFSGSGKKGDFRDRKAARFLTKKRIPGPERLPGSESTRGPSRNIPRCRPHGTFSSRLPIEHGCTHVPACYLSVRVAGPTGRPSRLAQPPLVTLCLGVFATCIHCLSAPRTRHGPKPRKDACPEEEVLPRRPPAFWGQCRARRAQALRAEKDRFPIRGTAARPTGRLPLRSL